MNPLSFAQNRLDAAQNRRRFLQRLSLGAAFFMTRGAFAQELAATPRQTEGPFYPDKLPLDTDNDLLILNDSITPAVGEITWLSGRVLDLRGSPIRNAVVEIWQCDSHGAYLHSGSANAERKDRNFQGFGRFVTGSSGEYVFRTIKPVSYPGRCPHVHFALKMKGCGKWTTQCYIKGDPGNERDGVWRSLREGAQRAAVTVEFVPLAASTVGELAARFDIVAGFTPEV